MVKAILPRHFKSYVGMGCAYLAKEITYASTNKLVFSALDNGAFHFDTAPNTAEVPRKRYLV